HAVMLRTGFFDSRMTANATPSTTPTACADTEMMIVLRRPSRIVLLKRKRLTTSQLMKLESIAAFTTQAPSSTMTAAATHRPQCRSGTARTSSAGTVTMIQLPPVDRGCLQRSLVDVPRLQHLVVAAIRDDRLQCRLDGIA